ncbi:hypothetical protein [Cellulosimicrobium funkei]|uniref:hypothetical protein n=1 Tax=Cellulosimicrobium funkei TaxID=264251 RepID=UPI003676F607
MTTEPRRALEEAQASEQECQTALVAAQEELLAAVATGLPARAEDLARAVSHSQPEVSLKLGKEGINAFRNDLRHAATELASELARSQERIKWPKQAGQYAPVNDQEISTALFNFLYGPRVDALASVFADHGFSTKGHGPGDQAIILPQSLFSLAALQEPMARIRECSQALFTAQVAVQTARRMVDQQAVNDLWDD